MHAGASGSITTSLESSAASSNAGNGCAVQNVSFPLELSEDSKVCFKCCLVRFFKLQCIKTAIARCCASFFKQMILNF